MKATSYAYKKGMQEPFRRRSHMRIRWQYNGTIYGWQDADIVTATITQEVDPLARKLPTESLTFGVIDRDGEFDPSNPQGKWEQMDEGVQLLVEFGFDKADGTTEWLSSDTYYLDGHPTYTRNIATFWASSILAKLKKSTYYKSYMVDATLANLAGAVLLDAGLSSSSYEIDADLSGIQCGAAFPLKSHAEILQMIAHAAGCALYSRGNKIRIKGIDIDNLTYHPDPISLRDIAQGTHQADKTAPLQKVVVKRYAYTADASSSEIAKVDVTLSGQQTVHIEYAAATGITASISGGTIVSAVCYVNAADVTVTGSGAATITLTGKKIKSNTTEVEFAGDSDANHAVDIENNPLVTSSGSDLGNRAVDYFENRVSDVLTYRGDPSIEALDGIYLTDDAGEIYPAVVVKHVLRFNGALTGQITARRVQSIPARGQLIDKNLVIIRDVDDVIVRVISEGMYRSAYSAAEMDAFITAVLGA